MNLNHRIRLTIKWLISSLLLIAMLAGYTTSEAQTVHPVTASLQLVPPYSVYLADYSAPGNDKLRVILTLNDLTQPGYTIRLKLKVELNGKVIMQTDPAYRPQGINILPGMPQIITGTQLNEYLVSDHLQFINGFSRDNYERTKALPEGAYRICVTAYDYNRGDEVALSNDGCNIFFFQKNEAPLLNYPLCNTRVDKKDPQFINFTWSIRNNPAFVTGSSGTGYRFELFEVRPAGSNAEYIVRSSTPIYTTTSDAAMLTYGPAAPRLVDSMQYVWRVQAYDKDGRDAYQNNGYSQACVFTYGGVDPFAANNVGKPTIQGEALGERSARWWWEIISGKAVDGYNIQYRKQADSNSNGKTYDWNTKYVTDTLFHVFDLEPSSTYEARVQPVIKGINGFWSDLTSVHTAAKRVFECGKDDAGSTTVSDSSKPLNVATAGMVVRVGDFDMQLTEVSGGNGQFTGYGAVTTPLLGLKLNVKYTNVQINDRLQLTQGEVTALSDGIDAWIADRTKVQHDVETIKGWTETMPGFDTASLPTLKEFAIELLGISEGIWTDTYVFTESERKDVLAALQEVKAAMEELTDTDPSNDAAAETKLRETLKKVEPSLTKLSENIGKGVLVKLGLIKDRLVNDGLTDIKASVEDALKKLAYEEDEAKGSLAWHGPNGFGGKEWDGQKENLQAKSDMITAFLGSETSRTKFVKRIQYHDTEGYDYLVEQDSELTPQLEKEENQSKSSKELLTTANWDKVIEVLNKELDQSLEAAAKWKGAVIRNVDANAAASAPAEDDVYYLAPNGKPLNLKTFKGVVTLATTNGERVLPYVVAGFKTADVGVLRVWKLLADGSDHFVCYFNEADSFDLFDLSPYEVKGLSKCSVELPFSIDPCYVKVIKGFDWVIPENLPIEKVQELLKAYAAPLMNLEINKPKPLMVLRPDGTLTPQCLIEGTGGEGIVVTPGTEVSMLAPSIVNQDALLDKLHDLGLVEGAKGRKYFDRIIITDENITTAQLDSINKTVADDVEANPDFRGLWIRLTKEGAFLSVSITYGKDVPQEVQLVLNVFKDYMEKVGQHQDMDHTLTVISDGLRELAEFIKKAKIPAKFYDPKADGYDPDRFVYFLFKQMVVYNPALPSVGPLLAHAPGIEGLELDESQLEFAFYCGVWNGLVDQVAGIPESASWLIDMITDKDQARQKFVEGIQSMNDKIQTVGFCSYIGQLFDTTFKLNNPCLSAHNYGQVTSQALTFFLAVAKVGQATKLVNLLDKMDVVGGLVELTLSPALRSLAAPTKLILKGAGKVSLGVLRHTGDVVVAFWKGSKSMNGRLCSFTVPFATNIVGAAEEIVDKLKKIKRVVQEIKDENGNNIRDLNNRKIVLIESEDGTIMHAAMDELGSVVYAVGKYANIDAWLATYTKKADFEKILIDWDDDLLRKLDNDLGHPKHGPEIRERLDADPEDLNNIWKFLKEDPDRAWELSKASLGNWEKWREREFFKYVTQTGKEFEGMVKAKILAGEWREKLKAVIKEKFGVEDLDNYELEEQIQFKYNGEEYFIADQVYVKYRMEGDVKVVEDMIVIENKLSEKTALTPNQEAARQVVEYTPRGGRLGGGTCKFKDGKIKWVKVYDHGDGSDIKNITDKF